MAKINIGYRRLPSGTHQLRVRQAGRKEKNINFPKSLTKKDVLREKAILEKRIFVEDYNPFEDARTIPPIAIAVREYIIEKERKDWNEKTAKGQRIRLMQMKDRLPPEFKDVSSWEWWNEPQWSAYTKKGFFITTRAFLYWAKAKGYIESFDISLSRKLKAESNAKPLRAITEAELSDICKAHLWISEINKRMFNVPKEYNPQRHIELWKVVFKLTLRKAEIPKVQLSDVEAEHINLIRKGANRQRLYIYESLKPHIDWFRNNQIKGKPFFGFSNMSSPANRLRIAMRMALGSFEGDYGFHTLRHAGITHMIYEGVSVPTVSKYAGHSSVSITLDRYAHVIESRLKDEMDGL